MADYEVFLLGDDWTRLDFLPRFHNLKFVMTANAPGAFQIDYSHLDVRWLAPDRIVEIWRRSGDFRFRCFTGLLRKWPDKTARDGARQISLVGEGLNGILDRRIVAYRANTPQADKHGPADDLMKAVVRENLGRLAEEARNLTDAGFTVQSDVGAGPVVSKAVEWISVLDALQHFAKEAAGTDDEVFFDVVPVSKGVLEFQTWIGQRGMDRTEGAGICYFGLEQGNLSEPELAYDHSKERNFVYVGGQGDGEKKIVLEVEDAGRVGVSVWNRCEVYESAPSDISDGGLQSVGDGVLAEMAPGKRIRGTLQDTKAAQWGKDWNFGDRVLVRYEGEYLPVVIRAMDVEVNYRGQEKVRGLLDASTGGEVGEGLAGIFSVIRSLRKKVDQPENTDGFRLDFTGTLWDTKEKCRRVGLRWSDEDDPFPGLITWNAPTGTWSHAAGQGWQPFSTGTDAGPAFLFTLAQGHEWEVEIEVDLRDASLSTRAYIELCYLTNSGHTGAIAGMCTDNVAYKRNQTYLYLNDGDDTYTLRYTGTRAASGLLDMLGLRNKSACTGIYDEMVDSWNDYKWRGSTGKAYNAATIALQIRRFSTVSLDEMFIRSLSVRYLDRS